MPKTYYLQLRIDGRSIVTPFRSREDALDAVLDAYMLTYPEDEDVHHIPEPFNQKALLAFLSIKRLHDSFSFEIGSGDGENASEGHLPFDLALHPMKS